MALSLFVIGALHAIVSLPLIIAGHVRYSRYRRLVKQSAHQSIIPYIAPTPGGAMAGIGGTF